jgi:imidazolonepropionase-like amidohydrolase
MRPALPIALALLLAGASPALAETLYVRAGHLVDPEAGQVFEDRLIRIEDGRVTAVSGWSPPPAGARLVDWSGYWVLPGLIDTHTHLADVEQSVDLADPLRKGPVETAFVGARHARITLEAGFTSVHDVGSYRGTASIELKRAIERGDVPGPRMSVTGGYITRPDGGGELTGLPKGMKPSPDMRLGVVSGAADTRRKVNRMFDLGADSIKLIATGAVLTAGTEPGQIELSEAEMRAAVEVAAQHHSWVTAHAHGAEGIKSAIRAGVRGIEHASLIDDEGIALAKAHGVFLSMDIYNGDYIAEIGRRDGWSAEILRKNDETTEAQRQGFARAVKAGVKLSFGTDAGVYPHGLNARQFKYMVRYGMTPMQAIQAATTVSAEMMGWSKDVGALSPGHWADMIAVDENPLGDISALERIDHVMKDGVTIR